MTQFYFSEVLPTKMVYLTEAELRTHIANSEYLSTDETVHYDECFFSTYYNYCFVSWVFFLHNPTFFSGQEKRLVYTYRCAMRALGRSFFS